MLQLSLALPLGLTWVPYSPSILINGQTEQPFRFPGRQLFPMQRNGGLHLALQPIVLRLAQPQRMTLRTLYVVMKKFH